MKTDQSTQRWVLTTATGIVLFLACYFIAAHYYPGGSAINRTSRGFDWVHNYWCDLLTQTAINGEQNEARGIALLAMVFLFSALNIFWFFLTQFFHERRFNKLIIRCTGIISVFVLMFIFTSFHDVIVGVGGALMAVPLAATLKELYNNKLIGLCLFGCVCILLILLNFFMYMTHWWIIALPLIQKLTLLLFLVWVLLIGLYCLKIRPENKRSTRNKQIR